MNTLRENVRQILVLGLFIFGAVPSEAQTVIRVADRADMAPREAREFQFELIETPGKQVRLSLDARVRKHGGLGGYTSGITLTVNDKGVLGRCLINKKLSTTIRKGRKFHWSEKDHASYVLYYSSNFSDETRRFINEEYIFGSVEENQDPFRFVWDITSLVEPGTNVLTVRAGGQGLGLGLGDVTIEIGDPIPSVNVGLVRSTTAPTGPLPIYAPKPPFRMPAVYLSSGDGIGISSPDGRRFYVRSRTSLPEGKWVEWGRVDEEKKWPRLRRGRSGVTRWSGQGYKVERSIRLHADHIAVADTVTNTSDKLVGVIFENRLLSPEKPDKVLLAGLERPLKKSWGSVHPTAIALYDGLTVGVAAEDDILRMHSEFFEEEDAIGFADRSLGIAPGQSHTLEWSIYLVENGDYWDFINALRRNWGVNFTLNGPLGYPEGKHYLPVMWYDYLTTDYLRKWLQEDFDGSVAFIPTGPAQNASIADKEATRENRRLYHGTAILENERFLDRLARLVTLMKEVDPSVAICSYIHPNLSTETEYWNKYRDSVARDINGNIIKSAYHFEPGLFIPTVNNSYGRALRKVYQHLVDELGANLYIDEIAAGPAKSRGPYKEWDGCTVRINPSTHELLRKESEALLLMQPWLQELMDYLAARGRVAYANTPARTRTMLNWRLQQFSENEGEGGVKMHLGTPLVFGARHGVRGFHRLMDSLDYGTIAFRRHEGQSWMNHMFPLTPLELRAGMIIAEERIITNRSGKFGWGDDSTAEILMFNGEGAPVDSPEVKEVREGEKVFYEVRMPGDHLAILVRERRKTR